MDFRRLRYFVAVAEELSFTRAAARLGMAQPPLSTQIQALEADLGVSLFNRSRRAISLTAAGRMLLPEARRLLRDLEHTTRLVQRAGDGTVGRLVAGFVPSAASGVLPDLLRHYRERFPRVELSLQERPPDDLIQLLHEQRIDVAFLFGPFGDETLASQCVCTEHFVVALPERHWLAVGGAVDAHALVGEPLILPTQHQTPGLFSRITELFDRFDISPVVVQREVWMMQTIVGLVAAGIGLAVVPSSAATLQRTGVVFRPLAQTIPPLEMTVAWRRDATSPTLSGFLDTARARAMDIPAPTHAVDTTAVRGMAGRG